MSGSQKLRRIQRLRGADVARALKEGRRKRTARLRLSSRPNGLPLARIALVVAKRHLPKAVDRNRAKRLMREAFRRHQQLFAGYDVVIRLDSACADRQLEREEIESLLLSAPLPQAAGHA